MDAKDMAAPGPSRQTLNRPETREAGVALLSGSKSEEEWDANVRSIREATMDDGKKKPAGNIPRWWNAEIIQKSLKDRVRSKNGW